MYTVPHFDGFALDPIKVAGPSTRTSNQKKTAAKAQMVAFSNN